MVIVDTSVWIDIFRNADGSHRSRLDSVIGEHEIVLTRFHQLELLQGCRDEHEWGLLTSYLDTQDYLPMGQGSWSAAARIYFDLRRKGLTVRSPIDCCIAQLALQFDALLIHRDHDFEQISRVRALRERYLLRASADG